MTNNPIAKSIHAIYLLNISAMIEEFELLQKIQNDTDRNLKVKSMPGKKLGGYFIQNLLATSYIAGKMVYS
jgi:hypothetical protein